MNILVTSLAIAAIDLNFHLNEIGMNKWGTVSIKDHNFVAYNDVELSKHFFATEDTLASCATNSDLTVFRNVAEDLINEGGCQGRFSLEYSAFSCILINTADNTLCLVADSVGSMPLWYGFADVGKKEYIATTDLLVAARYGFKNLSPLGPGQALELHLGDLEIVGLTHWGTRAATSDRSDILINFSLVDSTIYSKSLLSAAMHSIDATAAISKSMYFTEVDALHTSSQLLDCACDALELTRAIRFTRPLVENVESMVSDARFKALVEPVRNLKVQGSGHLRQASFGQIAAERWQVCKAADHAGVGTVLLSFDSGRDPRPTEVFFQNLFCRLLNVTVAYPFASSTLQRAAWSVASHVSDSLFAQAVPVLRTNGACNTSTPPENKSRAFEMQKDTQTCDGIKSAGCVDQLVVHKARSELGSVDVNDYNPELSVSKVSHDFHREIPSLWRVAKRHSTPEGFIVLVLATSGYLDLLENFFHSVTALQTSNQTFRHILIITPDQEVAALGHQYQVGVFMPSSSADGNSTGYADFGTLSYQRLILKRTECAMELMMLGFKPIIADIDTVWLRNPLEFIDYPLPSLPHYDPTRSYPTYDIAFTDDGGEVCGCFVVLTNSPQAVRFWRTVLQRHQHLVANATQNGAGLLKEFADSEQKILTELLYKKQYDNKISARLLSKRHFPPGLQFFNKHIYLDPSLNLSAPAIVHNNFLVGRQMKVTRFQRYNMWKSGDKPIADYNDSASTIRTSVDLKNTLKSWSALFSSLVKNIAIPSLTVILPVHDSSIASTGSKEAPKMIQMVKEGTEEQTGKRLTVWLENDPPIHYTFGTNAILDVNINSTNTVGTFTGIVEDTNIEVSVDLLLNRSHFSALTHPQRANEVVLQRMREHKYVDGGREVTPELAERINHAPIIGDAARREANSSSLILEYKIKVLAYKRPGSLSRLLQSLAAADYLSHKIGLEILIDGYIMEEDASLVRESQQIAEDFVWPHGPKNVVSRVKNMGLAGQWHSAWTPNSERELAFIFEDDIEVSPYFFVWAHRASLKYYASNEDQLSAHWKLLEAVRAHVKGNHTEEGKGKLSAGSPLDEFNRLFSGTPLLYGVCLQNQHLDPLHYPKKLSIRNGYRPFLFSLIGSWGPLMFPLPWQAFNEWWAWRAGLALNVMTESIVVNHFRKSNKKNWTPWHVRFAYESGLKCLYSNLPRSFALVVNHREAGENYLRHMGPSSTLLDHETLMSVSAMEDHASASGENVKRQQKALRWSLLHLPDLFHLERWQYDLHVRRPGAFGLDKLFQVDGPPTVTVAVTVEGKSEETHSEVQVALASLENDNAWFLDAMTSLPLSRPSSLSSTHWLYVLGMLDAHLLPDARVLHLGVNPLIPSLARYSLSHTVLSPSAHCERLVSVYSDRVSVTCVSTEEPIARRESFDLVIVTLPFVTFLVPGGDYNVGRQFWQVIPAPEFILVLLDVCSSAPTDVEIESGDDGDLRTRYRYSMVEDVCNEGLPDIGAVLYRQSTGRDDDRFALSRRYEGGLVARTIIQQKNVSTFN